MKIPGSLSLALVSFVLGANAAAQTSGSEGAPMTLHWRAPPECPTSNQVLKDVRSIAAQGGVDAGRPRLVVDGVVERLAANRFRLRLTIDTAERQFEAPSCDELARAGALFLALLLAPADSGGIDTTQQSPSAGAVTLPIPARNRQENGGPLSVRSAPSTERKSYVLALAGVTLDRGTLPGIEPLATLGVGIRHLDADLIFSVAAGPARDTGEQSGGAHLRSVNLMLEPCFAALITRRARLGPCALGEVGWMHAQAFGVSQPQTTNALWLSVGGELAASLAISRDFEARLGAALLLPLLRPRFEFTGFGPLFEPGLAVRASAAAVVRF